MTIDPVKIPQNVYVEDRIIGPVTLRQIMIVMIATGVSYAIWAAMKAAGPVSQGQTVLAWTPTAIGAAFAFVKINGISLLRIVLLTIEKIDKPSRRIWQPRKGIYVNFVTKTPAKKTTAQPKTAGKNAHIEELSRVLDQGPAEDEDDPIATAKPVNPDRIQADEGGTPVDDIAPKEDTPPSMGGGLMRDITPPSHA